MWLLLSLQPVTAYDLSKASRETGLSETLIYAIALAESGWVNSRSGQIEPWAWTINAGGKSLRFETRDEAAHALSTLIAQGRRNIDVGLMQISVRWNGDLVVEPVDLLDPAVNLWAFTQVVLECQSRGMAGVEQILACYHAGSPQKKHGQKYATRVLRQHTQVLAGGSR